MDKSARVTLIVISVIVVCTGVFTYTLVSRKQADELNDAKRLLVPDSETVAPYTDLSGNETALDAHLGKVLIINNWASWSPMSVDELPMIERVVTDYKEDEVAVLAINRSETKEQVERFMRTLGEFDRVNFVLDPDDHYYETVGGFAMPETIIYNQSGQQVYQKRGRITEEELREHIDDALTRKRIDI